DVGVAVVDDVVLVHRGIDDRVALQGVGHGLDEEAHEAELDAVGLLEGLAMLLAHVHDRLHVDLVERGQHGDRVLGVHQALGDAGAHAGHRHALFRAVAAGLAGAGVARVVEQVFLGHRATAAGALDVRRVDALADRGEARARGQVAGLATGLRRRRRGRCGLLLFLAAGFGLVVLRLRLRLVLAALVAALGDRACLDASQHLFAGHGVAGLVLDLLEHAVDGGGDLQYDLVGLEVDQVLVTADGVAGLLVPGGDGGVGDGFGQYRNFDLGAHGVCILKSWNGAWVAGAAAVPRPAGSVGGVFAAERVDQGIGDQPLLLDHVVGEVADGGRGGARTAGVVQALALGQAMRQVVADLVPRALVLRLFLAPDHVRLR